MTQVDVLYSNTQVFSPRGSLLSPVIHWLTSNFPYADWSLVDRDPDDPFPGETFQFNYPHQAVLFKLAWGGR